MKWLAESRSEWAIPWTCLHEFLAVVTNPGIYKPPSSSEQARDQIRSWLESPTVRLLHEGEGYFDVLDGLLKAAPVAGGRVHDARIAAVCLFRGVTELWSADRDFRAFPRLRTRNPLPDFA